MPTHRQNLNETKFTLKAVSIYTLYTLEMKIKKEALTMAGTKKKPERNSNESMTSAQKDEMKFL